VEKINVICMVKLEELAKKEWYWEIGNLYDLLDNEKSISANLSKMI